MTERLMSLPSLNRASLSTLARTAGIAYVVTIAAGLFAEVYARGAIWIPKDPLRTAENLERFTSLYRWAIFSDYVMIVAYVVVTALLYRLFKPTSATLSLVAALMSILGLALLTVGTAMLAFPLQAGAEGYASDALRLHASFYKLTGIFFGAYCLLIGMLSRRSELLPRVIGWLMIAAGVVFAGDAALWLVAPQTERLIPDAVLLVSLVGEGSFAIWLTAAGIRQTERGA